jgi:hypothetical protein
MTVHTFAYVILVILALISTYAIAVSTNEPPLEDYEHGGENESVVDSPVPPPSDE